MIFFKKKDYYKEIVICNNCLEYIYHKFKKGTRVIDTEITCPKCGLTGRVYRARGVSGFINNYIN